MTYGIILLFYDYYSEKAVREFKYLLERVDPDYRLIIVDNHGGIANVGEKVIRGNNINWEFSGWDTGLSTLSTINDSDVFIFCNDTFCHHNTWNASIRERFCKVFRSLVKNNKQKSSAILSGTTDSVWKGFSLSEKKFNYWVSSYLFLMTGSLLNKMGGRLCIEEEILNRYISMDSENNLVWGSEVSFSLQSHLTRWLFEDGEDVGWYNKRNISFEKKIRKVKAIFNEKYLTANCLFCGGRVIEVMPLKKMKMLIWRLLSKFNCWESVCDKK